MNISDLILRIRRYWWNCFHPEPPAETPTEYARRKSDERLIWQAQNGKFDPWGMGKNSTTSRYYPTEAAPDDGSWIGPLIVGLGFGLYLICGPI